MVIHTSALVAVLFDEPERERVIRAIATAPRRSVSSGTLLEASIAVEARRGEVPGRELDLFLHRAKVATVAVDETQVEVARAAWRRDGAATRPA